MEERVDSLHDILGRLRRACSLFSKGVRQGGVGLLEAELREMENAFALVLMGAFSGMPSPPGHISIALLPFLEREMAVMISRSLGHDDRLSEWAGLVDL